MLPHSDPRIDLRERIARHRVHADLAERLLLQNGAPQHEVEALLRPRIIIDSVSSIVRPELPEPSRRRRKRKRRPLRKPKRH